MLALCACGGEVYGPGYFGTPAFVMRDTNVNRDATQYIVWWGANFEAVGFSSPDRETDGFALYAPPPPSALTNFDRAGLPPKVAWGTWASIRHPISFDGESPFAEVTIVDGGVAAPNMLVGVFDQPIFYIPEGESFSDRTGYISDVPAPSCPIDPSVRVPEQYQVPQWHAPIGDSLWSEIPPSCR